VHASPTQLLCYSHHRGHTPHYIQVLHSIDDDQSPPLPDRLVQVHDDGTFIVDIDGACRHLWNHDPARLAALVERNRGQVTYQSRWGLLRTPSLDGSFVFSVCGADEPRRSCLRRPPIASVRDIIEVAGGFTIQV
jgi:hypothetical protein